MVRKMFVATVTGLMALGLGAGVATEAQADAWPGYHYVAIYHYTPGIRSVSIWNSVDGGWKCYNIGGDVPSKPRTTGFVVANGRYVTITSYWNDGCNYQAYQWSPTPQKDGNTYFYINV